MPGEMRSEQRTLVRNHEGKRPLWRPRHRQVFNIKVDLKEIWC
jgi:hypothetical protein